jgi:cytochrome c oxidase subunit 4
MKSSDHNEARLWTMPCIIWLALLALLAMTVAASYLPLGIGNGIASMSIAAVKAALILIFFMKLKSSSPLIRLLSLSGIFWLIFLFSLTASDYLTRH